MLNELPSLENIIKTSTVKRLNFKAQNFVQHKKKLKIRAKFLSFFTRELYVHKRSAPLYRVHNGLTEHNSNHWLLFMLLIVEQRRLLLYSTIDVCNRATFSGIRKTFLSSLSRPVWKTINHRWTDTFLPLRLSLILWFSPGHVSLLKQKYKLYLLIWY